jgi:hypothetical protein
MDAPIDRYQRDMEASAGIAEENSSVTAERMAEVRGPISRKVRSASNVLGGLVVAASLLGGCGSGGNGGAGVASETGGASGAGGTNGNGGGVEAGLGGSGTGGASGTGSDHPSYTEALSKTAPAICGWKFGCTGSAIGFNSASDCVQAVMNIIADAGVDKANQPDPCTNSTIDSCVQETKTMPCPAGSTQSDLKAVIRNSSCNGCGVFD